MAPKLRFSCKPLFWLDMGLNHNFAEGSGIYWPEKIVKPQKSHHRWRRQRPQIFNFLSKFPIFWGFWLFSPSKWLSTAKSGKEFLKYRLFWVWESWQICQNAPNIATVANQKCLVGKKISIFWWFWLFWPSKWVLTQKFGKQFLKSRFLGTQHRQRIDQSA